MIQKVLIIDNDTTFAKTLQNSLETYTSTLSEIESDLSVSYESINHYDLYIIRLDEKSDATIEKLSDDDKFVIILTDQDTKEIREKILSHHVTDYVITNTLMAKDFVTKIVQRVIRNAEKNILIVDDSKVILTQISMLLEMQNISHIQCLDGKDALEYLNDPASKKIDLVVTDYEMPLLNGYELVKQIRDKYALEELPVLVLSGSEDTYMISRFLKAGANDFITKPFLNEEFLSRINNAISVGDMFEKIKNMAMTDHLTGLHNRAYFYDTGVKVIEIEKRANKPLALAMLDIDNFKNINDTHGHELGDRALIHISQIILKTLRASDVFVRFGGEEFVVLLPNCTHINAIKTMQKVCKNVAEATLKVDEKKSINITLSIGVNSKLDAVDKMLERADKFMYTAKESGKNRVYSQE